MIKDSFNDDFVKKNLKIFLKKYNNDKKESYWNSKSQEFYDFWGNKIRDKDYTLKQSDTDYLVRIIDSKARGHQEEDEAIARVGILQDLWESAFNDLKNNIKLQDAFDKILKTRKAADLIPLIDNFLFLNKGNSNGLNGSGANMINAFLFLKNPNVFLSVLSLNHRELIMKKFGLGRINQNETQGEKIVKSNFDISNNFNKKYNTTLTPRALSEFLYTPYGIYDIRVKETWFKNENIKRYTVRIKDEKCEIKMSELKLQKIDIKKAKENKTFSNRDYICTSDDEKEKQDNRSRKGLKGEDLVVDIEKQRLLKEGLSNLAQKVKKVSDNYSLGYDVLSYELDGSRRYIEVKSTSGNLKHNQFFITSHELDKSHVIKNYYIYFVYKIDGNPEIKFIKSPDLNDSNLFELIPQNYIVKYKAE